MTSIFRAMVFAGLVTSLISSSGNGAETESSVISAVRIPSLSVFRSLREVCIQTHASAVVDFGAWEASLGTLDSMLSQSRQAVRRSPSFAADLPVAEIFAQWCAANAGFKSTMTGKIVHVTYASAGQLAVGHQVLISTPLFAELTIARDDNGQLTWDTLASSLMAASQKTNHVSPVSFVVLTREDGVQDGWFSPTAWLQVKVPLKTAWNDSFEQVLLKCVGEGSPTMGIALSTPSTFVGGLIGYNPQRAQMPISEVIDGLKGSTMELRKKYGYTSALANRIDSALELYRRLSLDPSTIDEVAKSALIVGLLQTLDTDSDSESLLVLLHEFMHQGLTNHIMDVVKRQDIAIRKRYYFNTLPSPKGVADPAWKAHFTDLWNVAAQDPDADIRTFAKGSLE